MTLSYDFLHEHAIGRTSNEIARTTMRSIVRALKKWVSRSMLRSAAFYTH